MLTLPKIVTRDAQPYLFIAFAVSMETIKVAADEGFPELFGWLAKRGITPKAAPFFNYRRISMPDSMDIEVGVPVDGPIETDGRIQYSVLPGGRYAVIRWTGDYQHLMDVNAVLIGWAKEKGIAWDVAEMGDGDHFACRLEIYETDPMEEPDPDKWITEVAIKVAD
jgi:effector-binding domain-containing protein